MKISVIGPENLLVANLLRFGISEKRKIFFKLHIRIGYSEIYKIGRRNIFRPMADNIDREGRGGCSRSSNTEVRPRGSDGGRKDIGRGGET